jgi:uncharacterized protein involved in exopolysaccharide biosynthesis
MTFRTNKPVYEGVAQAGATEFPRTAVSAPAFKPQILRSVRMHPVLAAGVAAVVFAGLVGYALRQKMVYLAASQVYEEPASAKLLSTSADVFDANRYDTFLNEQMQLVQRLDVITAGLATLPPSAWREFGATEQLAAEAIQAALKVQRIATSYQISISLKGSNAARTAAIVNAITSAYLGAVHKESAAETDQRVTLLAEERERVEKELQTARAEQTALGASIGVASPTGDTGNPYDAETSGVRAQLTEARAAHDVAAAQLASLSGPGPSKTSGLTAAADELIAGDSGLGTMKSAISEKKAALTSQMAGMKPSNPIYQQDQEELADLDRTLDTATNELRAKASQRLQDKLRVDLERTGDIEARLNGELSRQIASATSAAPKLQRAGEVAADLQRLNLREAAVDDALRSLRMDSSAPEQVRLSLAATVPAHPEANRKKLLLIAALPLALLFGAGAAVFARKQDNKIYSGLDIEEVLGFQPLAVLPARADVPERVFDEYVLRLAAGVESAYRTNGARTFLLTAVSLTSDSTPLALALARKFEEIGVNAMMATASEMLTPTDGAPEETHTRTPGELARVVELWSEGFVAANMARMKSEHGLVLIESQALLNCAQTEYVARCADATILTVQCGVTTRQELFEAAELLHRLNVTGIGAVLEELQLRFADTAFRKAIDSLNRRQSEAVRKPVARVAPTAVDPAFEGKLDEEPEHDVQPELELLLAPEPEAEPEAEAEPVSQVEEHVPVLAQEPAFDEAETRVEPEPVAEEIPEPAEQPEMAAVAADATEEAVPVIEIRHEVVPAVALGPVLVDKLPVAVWAAEENIVSERVIAVANGSFREKISPTLSARRDESASGGDARMTLNTSWLDRLLRRNSESVFRIVPDRDETRNLKDVDNGDDEEWEESPSIAARVAKSKEEYDLPLVNRLDQISRSRQAAPPNAADPSSNSSRTPRLQIVPHEKPAPAPEALLTGLFPATGVADEYGETTAPEVFAAPPPPPAPMAMPQPAPEPVAVAKEPEMSAWQFATAEWKVEEHIPEPPVVWDPFAEPVERVSGPVDAVAASVEPVAGPAEWVADPVEWVAEPVDAVAEPVEAVAEPVVAVAEPVEAVAEPVEWIAEPLEPAGHPVELSPEPVAVWAPEHEEVFAEPVSPPLVEVAHEVPIAASLERPRRPLTFHQLAGETIAPAATPEPPKVVVPEPALQEAALPEPAPQQTVIPPSTEPETDQEMPAQVSEAEAEHFAAPVSFEDEAVAEERGPLPEPVAEMAAADLEEPGYATPEYAGPALVPPSYSEPGHSEPGHSEPGHSEAGSPQQNYKQRSDPAAGYPAASESEPQLEPVRTEEAEPYDVEPAYREASRSLTTGRWDPIPPLRPSGTGWRDRPSPVPASNPVAVSDRRRWTGSDDTPQPPNRSDFEPHSAPGEPLSEPLLTRQWGLLSRFQQARISSSRTAPENPEDKTPGGLPPRDRQR